MRMHSFYSLALAAVLCSSTSAADWTRFRGPNGSGVSVDEVPTKFSDSENVKWKIDLPGPGLSSPIVVGDKVIVTCWDGYADGSGNEGSLDDLNRHVICVSKTTGDELWSHAEPAKLPEDSFQGMFAENGYASHSPATDGERVYVFFGKTGVFAFDLETGRKLWEKTAGENRERRGWGSASSPIVVGKNVVVPAFIESDSLIAFDGATGNVAWKQEVPGYTSNWSTPVVVEAQGRTDLVLSVPGEVWGLNPENGKLRWYCELPGSDDARASVTAKDDVVIAMAGGRGASTSIAVRAGGKGDVAETHKLWQGRDSSGISTPVVHGNRLYVVSDKRLTTIDMSTGERLGQLRISGGSAPAGGGQRGGRGGFGGGGRDYASPVIAGQHLYYSTGDGNIYVFGLGDEPSQVSVNRFDDGGQYNATPAISDGAMYIRSTKSLFCVAASR